MRWTAATLLGTLLVLAAPALLPGAGSQTNGVGLTPTRFDVPDAQPGQTYVQVVTVQNGFGTPSTMTVDADGEAGAWATTDPASGFAIPAESERSVTVTVTVPEGGGPGTHLGEVRFTTEPKADPSGTGASTRYAVGLLLNFTVAGQARPHITWVSVRAPDVQAGQAPVGYATAANDGNVAATATMGATATAVGAGPASARANGTGSLDPGETQEFPVAFGEVLPPGQYVMHFASTEPAGFTHDVDFRVLRPGENPPHGTLRAIRHVPFGDAGSPVRLDGWFRNDGSLGIASAVLSVEVSQDGRLLAALKSEPLAVRVGQDVNLTVYWTPPSAGTYDVIGHVTYDGYVTPDSSSPLNVHGPAGGSNLWWLLLALVVAALVGTWWSLREREKRRKRAAGPKRPAR